MVVKWIKRVLIIVLTVLTWQKRGFLLAIGYLFICLPLDFFALLLANKLAIKGFQAGKGEQARQEAAKRLLEYQRIPGSPSTPLVTFSQLVLGPILSISIPIIVAGLFPGWFS